MSHALVTVQSIFPAISGKIQFSVLQWTPVRHWGNNMISKSQWTSAKCERQLKPKCHGIPKGLQSFTNNYFSFRLDLQNTVLGIMMYTKRAPWYHFQSQNSIALPFYIYKYMWFYSYSCQLFKVKNILSTMMLSASNLFQPPA